MTQVVVATKRRRPALPGNRVVSQLVRDPSAIVGLSLLTLLILLAVLAPVISPHGSSDVQFGATLNPPLSDGHLLGTDELGRDVLSRILYGTGASLLVGAIAVLVSTSAGILLGLMSGYWRPLDTVLSRLTDVMLAFPFLVLAVGLTAINGPSLANAALAIGISYVPVMVRVVRAETFRIASSDYIVAARTMNASSARIIATHILPNALPAIVVQATIIMPMAIIAEAILSFLGLGIQPPSPSLGIMLSDAQQYATEAPFLAIFPGIAIALICFAFNLLGDSLRDALDPSAVRR
jgi:peptide/nickel transport system permease protein